MTGSGSAVFGLFNDSESLNTAFNQISVLYPNTFKTSTCFQGTQIFV
jgi:4-diphosphocytidyl-2C-methyl-D-erythritol kinase